MSNSHNGAHRSHPAHPQQAAATPTAPATPPYKPLNFSFPFAPAGKDDAGDPMTYMRALGNAQNGFYPIGANGLWHGGIHFDGKTGNALKQDVGIRAIADGEVVAYRLDSKYPELEYQDKRSALYSTGFVLIRHKLQLPPPQPKPDAASPSAASAPGASSTPAVPASAGSTAGAPAAASSPGAPAQPPKPPAADTLVFFSLYMHLLDWVGYKIAMEAAKEAPVDPKAPQIQPMPFWEGDRYYRVGAKAKDKQEVPKPKPPASPVPLTQQAGGEDSDPIATLIRNDFKLPPPAAGDASDAKDDTPPPSPVTGIRVRDSANGKIIGLLPTGSELIVSTTEKSDKPGWAKIATIRSGTPVGAVAGQPASPHVPYGWVYVNELDVVIDPKPLDQVVVLKTPFAVTAGTVIGYLGQYQDYSDSSSLPPGRTHPMLHLETFAGPDLEDFISRSRERARQLPESKAFLEISPGALLVTDVPEPDQTLTQTGLHLVPLANVQGSRWVRVQPKIAPPATPGTSAQAPHGHPGGHHGHHPAPPLQNTGTPLWVDATLANQTTTGVVKGWKDFPLKVANAKGPGAEFRDVFRRVDLDKLGVQNIAKDDRGQRWWNITIGTKDGATRQGWVCEKDQPLTRMCGPWDWPGFELIDHSSIKPVDMLKRYLHVTQQLIEGEDKSEFESSASLVNGGELITKLEKAVDANHDGKVTAQELRLAQQTPWLAEALSHLVVRCESEWGGGPGKWDDLSPLMKKLLWLWKSELQRINRLQWWEQVSGVEGFPKEPTPWHFHPVGLIGNFSQSCNCIDIDRFVEEYKKRHSEDFGWYENANSPKTTLGPLNEASEQNLRTLLAGIKTLFVDGSDKCNLPHIAYMLATSRIESYDFRHGVFFGPIREGISPEKAEIDYGCGPTARRAQVARDHGNTAIGDGYKYRGRGLVQITWKKKYAEFAQILNLPLVENPDLAIEWSTALKIMVIGMRDGVFTGHSLSDYLSDSQKDYVGARRIINGTDKARVFAEYAVKFEKLLIETR